MNWNSSISPGQSDVFQRYAVCLFICLGFICHSVAQSAEPGNLNPLNNEISIESRLAKGVVTLAPNLTEIVYALGQGHHLKGVSSFDTYPEAVLKLPKVGGYFNPDLETILTLEPGLILMLKGRSTHAEQLTITGADIHAFTCENIEEIQTTISAIGELLNCPENAQALCIEMTRGLTELPLPGTTGHSIMVCVGMTPGSLQNCYVAGGLSMHHDILEAMGCKNAFGTTMKSYFPVNKEAIIIARPTIILDLIPGQKLTDGLKKNRLATWGLLPGVPAVKSGNICILNESTLNIPGPRINQAAQVIRSAIEGCTPSTSITE